MTSDMDGVKELFSWSFHRFFLAVFYGAASVAFMFSLCWQMAVLMIMLACFEVFFIAKISGRIRRLSEQMQEKKAESSQMYISLVKCIKCIKMLSLYQMMHKEYAQIGQKISEDQIGIGRRIAAMDIVGDLFSVINLLGTLSTGICLYAAGWTDLGSVMAFLTVQDGITYMFDNLKDFFSSWQRYMAHVKRVYEILALDMPEQKETSARLQDISGIQCQKASLEMVKRAAEMADALQFLEEREQGFSEMVSQQGAAFSGGQKQRIALARAYTGDKFGRSYRSRV